MVESQKDGHDNPLMEFNYDDLLAELSDEADGLSTDGEDYYLSDTYGFSTDNEGSELRDMDESSTDNEDNEYAIKSSPALPIKESEVRMESQNIASTVMTTPTKNEKANARLFFEDNNQSSILLPNDGEEEHSMVPYKGQTFDSIDEAKIFYTRYARKMGFGPRSRSTQKRIKHNDCVSSCLFVCEREGFHKKKTATPKGNDSLKEGAEVRNTSTKKCGCKARMRLTLLKDGRWKVTIFHAEHNHKPVTPSKRIFQKTNRHMPKAAKDLVDAFREENIPVSKVPAVLGGNILGFDERDCYNHLVSSNVHKTPKEGDATAMLNFFKKKQTEDPNFFYAIQPDKESRAVNFFWVDGRSRMQYQFFGVVLYFDTTYKKNLYKMPFSPFTGVNHHLHSIQFGCALLLYETEESFIWVFETWLGAMGGRPPISMITDQDPAMTTAIAKVFPDTRHRFCLWHILKKFPGKLSHLYKKKSKFKDFKKQIRWCIRGFYRVSDFEKRWNELMVKYELTENKWLNKLFQIKEKWLPVYHLDTFFAGMNTTGRSESMNSYYKDFFTLRTSLREFAYQNDKCLKRMVAREERADYESEHKDRIVEEGAFLLEHAAKLYTKAVYLKFKKQWDLAQKHYKLQFSKNTDELYSYTYKTRNAKDPREWNVEFNTKSLEGKCECKYFEFMKIPCGHLIKVFQSRDIDEIPDFFVARRWLQGANEYRAKYDGGVISGHENSKMLRATHISMMSNNLAFEAGEDDDIYKYIAEKIQDLSISVKERKKVLKENTDASNDFGITLENSGGTQKEIPNPPLGANVLNHDTFVSTPEDVSSSSMPINAPNSDNYDGSQMINSMPSLDSISMDAAPLETLLNPRISQTKGRNKEDHKSNSERLKGGLEKSQKKQRSNNERQCRLCLENKVHAFGHNRRTCPFNPDRKNQEHQGNP